MILGSALANSSHRHTAYCDHDYDYTYGNSSRVVTTRVISEGTYGKSDDVHLFRDRNGNCFEVFENSNGDEVREEIDPSYCEW